MICDSDDDDDDWPDLKEELIDKEKSARQRIILLLLVEVVVIVIIIAIVIPIITNIMIIIMNLLSPHLCQHRGLPELCILVRLQVKTNLCQIKSLLISNFSNNGMKIEIYLKLDCPLLLSPFLNIFVSCITHQHVILLWIKELPRNYSRFFRVTMTKNFH